MGISRKYRVLKLRILTKSMVFDQVIKYPVILKDSVPRRNWLIDVSHIHWNLNLFWTSCFDSHYTSLRKTKSQYLSLSWNDIRRKDIRNSTLTTSEFSLNILERVGIVLRVMQRSFNFSLTLSLLLYCLVGATTDIVMK